MSRIRLGLSLSIALSACVAGCGGAGSASPTSPTQATAIQTFSGTWTGTLSRPNGFAPISVSWAPAASKATNGVNLTGPVTLTVAGGSLTSTDSHGGLINGTLTFIFSVAAGSSPSFPSCFVSMMQDITASNVSESSTTFTSSPFDINYDSCQGFVAPEGITNFRIESSVLTLNKQ
jgi:hypothetical protein